MAQTITPADDEQGSGHYGWNYNGLPASTVLHWFPQLSIGVYTGQYQAAWSLAGNSSYVVMGGEFPKVNGVAQQGLVRIAVSSLAPNKQAPTYTTQPDRPIPATTATSPSPGTVSVRFGTAWDYDNETLTYDLFRDDANTAVKTDNQVELLDAANRNDDRYCRAGWFPHLPGADKRPVWQHPVEPDQQFRHRHQRDQRTSHGVLHSDT